MALNRTRREFLRDLGIRSAALPFVLNLPSLGFANQQQRKQRLVIMFSPNGIVPSTFWPDKEGKLTTFKESLKPLEPFKGRTLVLYGVCNQVGFAGRGGAGDAHQAGIGCLLTGIELLSGNSFSSGWSSGNSIDQEIKTYLQRQSATRTRFGSLEFGVLVPDVATTWTRMVYAGPNKPIAPIDDPHQMFAKLYGQIKDKDTLKSILDDLRDDLRKIAMEVSVEDRRLLEEHATFVREMEQELRSAEAKSVDHAIPNLKAVLKRGKVPAGGIPENAHQMPQISKVQIDLLVNSFAADFTRVATLQYTNSVGTANMPWLKIEDAHHNLSHAVDPDRRDADKQLLAKLIQFDKWYCEQLTYLARRLAETPEPGGAGSLLDNTLIVWTNELGQGFSHTHNNIPFVLVGNGLDFRMGRSLKYAKVPHNRLLLSLAHGMGHRIKRFGNPNLCDEGCLPYLT